MGVHGTPTNKLTLAFQCQPNADKFYASNEKELAREAGYTAYHGIEALPRSVTVLQFPKRDDSHPYDWEPPSSTVVILLLISPGRPLS